MTTPLLTPQHAARRLRLSVSRLRQLDRAGKFVALRDSGGRRLYDPEAVERFAVEREARRREQEEQSA